MLFVTGKKLIAVTSSLTLLFVLSAVLYAGGYIPSLPYVMKPTAHFAFALFFMAFSASSLHTLMPGAYSRWAMRNRRYIGLSFAAVHGIHLVLVLSNITLTPESRPLPVLLAGGSAYVLLALMAITSNNASVKKLGAKNWRWLHLSGSWLLWIVFFYGTPDVIAGNYARAWISILCLTVLVLRFLAYRKKHRKAIRSTQTTF